ncbi:radical SAM protein [Burkholderia pyrrocinia]|uniref:radical SAM protein n=1 Tax=Burkholderia pyrrocinia TaxID=60550 RepID=UPI00215AC271|nr:radical SAM protein [Burkholderia pyrrocinia]UVE69006.1 radical SAM protein [Burkholderia pyrrocinia]
MKEAEKINRLEVILKVTERCNIDCTYCYYFNGNNHDYTSQPPYLDIDTAKSVATYLRDAAHAYSIDEIQIDLHGGEPLLMKKSRMCDILEIFRNIISHSIDLRISIQTNATLLDEEWISIFIKYNVSVGVSLDGPPEENDLHRVDKKGNGTHSAVAKSIAMLIEKNKTCEGIFAGVICVINPDFDGRKIYRHLVDDLGIERIHFLKSNQTRDAADTKLTDGTGQFLLDALNEWINDSGRNIYVRQFTDPLKRICTPDSSKSLPYRFVAMTVRANGAIAIDDDFRNTLPSLFNLGLNVSNSTLADFINHSKVADFHRACDEVPSFCSQCGAKGICQSGAGLGESVLHRYSFVNKFRNASLFCKSHKAVIIELGKFALSHGVPWERIEKNMTEKQI